MCVLRVVRVRVGIVVRVGFGRAGFSRRRFSSGSPARWMVRGRCEQDVCSCDREEQDEGESNKHARGNLQIPRIMHILTFLRPGNQPIIGIHADRLNCQSAARFISSIGAVELAVGNDAGVGVCGGVYHGGVAPVEGRFVRKADWGGPGGAEAGRVDVVDVVLLDRPAFGG